MVAGFFVSLLSVQYVYSSNGLLNSHRSSGSLFICRHSDSQIASQLPSPHCILPNPFHLQQARSIFHWAQQLRDPRPSVSRCLLLPFTLEVNSSSWQATFIALFVLRGDNHHVGSLALGKKGGSGGREAKRGCDQREQRDPSADPGEEPVQVRMTNKFSSCVWRVRGESTPTSPRGGVWVLRSGTEADSGKPHPSQSLAPREWVSVNEP